MFFFLATGFCLGCSFFVSLVFVLWFVSYMDFWVAFYLFGFVLTVCLSVLLWLIGFLVFFSFFDVFS